VAPPPAAGQGSLLDVGYVDVVYLSVRCRIRANPCRHFLHAKSGVGKWDRPDCAPRRGGYQPFETSVARAGGGVNGQRTREIPKTVEPGRIAMRSSVVTSARGDKRHQPGGASSPVSDSVRHVGGAAPTAGVRDELVRPRTCERGNPAGPSRVDGGAGRTGTVKAGVSPGAIAGRAAMAGLR
jgi:hypothetical protein